MRDAGRLFLERRTSFTMKTLHWKQQNLGLFCVPTSLELWLIVAYSLQPFNLFLCRAAKHADKTVEVIPDLHERPSVWGDVQSSISEEISWNLRPLLLWRGRRSWNRGWKKMAGLKMVELCKMVVGFEDIIAHRVIITIRKWSQTHRISLPIRSGTLLEVLLFLSIYAVSV